MLSVYDKTPSSSLLGNFHFFCIPVTLCICGSFCRNNCSVFLSSQIYYWTLLEKGVRNTEGGFWNNRRCTNYPATSQFNELLFFRMGVGTTSASPLFSNLGNLCWNIRVILCISLKQKIGLTASTWDRINPVQWVVCDWSQNSYWPIKNYTHCTVHVNCQSDSGQEFYNFIMSSCWHYNID